MDASHPSEQVHSWNAANGAPCRRQSPPEYTPILFVSVRERRKENPTDGSHLLGMSTPHSTSQPLPSSKMPGPIVHNETTTMDQGGFVAILANLTRRAIAMAQPLETTTQERSHRFTGRTTSYEPEAIQLETREAIVQLRHLSPRVKCRSFYYYPSREGYGRPLQVTSGDHETDPALLHLVRYLRAQEALYDQVTLVLLAAREELACLETRRRGVEPDGSNPVVLFEIPIELLRSISAADQNHAPNSCEELHRILGISSNSTVTTTPRNGNHRYPSILAPPPSPSNRDAMVPGNSTSARPAHLDVNEVD
ncbi:hypothetical protein D1007_29849 [Hordeum vulgare]|nr:hypothetical protein D1007_29849 [Hordeum vulgare]